MATANQYPDDVVVQTATIASSGTTSGEIDLGGTTLVGIEIPSAITGTSMTFTTASAAGGTFVPIQNGGTGVALSVTIAASKRIPLGGYPEFKGCRFIKLVSGSSEAAARSIKVFSKP